jgi:hypothetical protein
MKTIIARSLAVLMLCTIFACSKKTDTKPNTTTTGSTTSSSTTGSTTATTPTSCVPTKATLIANNGQDTSVYNLSWDNNKLLSYEDMLHSHQYYVVDYLTGGNVQVEIRANHGSASTTEFVEVLYHSGGLSKSYYQSSAGPSKNYYTYQLDAAQRIQFRKEYRNNIQYALTEWQYDADGNPNVEILNHFDSAGNNLIPLNTTTYTFDNKHTPFKGAFLNFFTTAYSALDLAPHNPITATVKAPDGTLIASGSSVLTYNATGYPTSIATTVSTKMFGTITSSANYEYSCK